MLILHKSWSRRFSNFRYISKAFPNHFSRSYSTYDDSKQLISQVLRQFKQTSEVKQYLRYYGSAGRDKFAIIRVSGDILHSTEHRFEVASALAFLQRVGLTPVVVHGAGVFTGRKSENVEKASLEGSQRQVLHEAIEYMINSNVSLVQELKKLGARTESVLHNLSLEKENKHIVDSLNNGNIPIIASFGISNLSSTSSDNEREAISEAFYYKPSPAIAKVYKNANYASSAIDDKLGDKLVTFSTISVVEKLAYDLKPLKIISLRPEGGLRGVKDEKVIQNIELSTNDVGENDILNMLNPKDHDEYLLCKRMINCLEFGSTFSITEPKKLTSELLTHKGDGTLITKGEQIWKIHDLYDDRVDFDRIKLILESSFRSELPNDFFLKLSTSIETLYLAESYRGLAIVTREKGLGFSYLSKFAVVPSAQGDRLGLKVWNALVTGESTFFWRSRRENPVNGWYFEQSDGCVKGEKWSVFWKGDVPKGAKINEDLKSLEIEDNWGQRDHHGWLDETIPETETSIQQKEMELIQIEKSKLLLIMKKIEQERINLHYIKKDIENFNPDLKINSHSYNDDNDDDAAALGGNSRGMRTDGNNQSLLQAVNVVDSLEMTFQ